MKEKTDHEIILEIMNAVQADYSGLTAIVNADDTTSTTQARIEGKLATVEIYIERKKG